MGPAISKSDTTVKVTVDGHVYQVRPGLYNMPEFQAALGRQLTPIAKLTITTSAPAQATSINGNDSFTIQGGEVMISVVGK